MTRSNSLPLRITTAADGTPSVILGGQELAMHLARDGVEIRYVDGFGRQLCESAVSRSVPEVTLTFGPGALDLDFDVELLEHLLAAKESNS